MFLLFFYILLALVLSFVCSVMEAVLLSITPAYIAQKEKEDRRKGRSLRRMKDDIESPLAAILSLNTIAHTLGAAGAGAQAAHIFGDKYVGIISAVLTLAILIFSEIIPKTIGALYWKNLAPYVVFSVGLTHVLMYPLVVMSNGITGFLKKGSKDGKVDKDEFEALMEKAVKDKIFSWQESSILRNIILFRKLPVRQIMTPRTVLYALEEDMTVDEILAEDPDMIFSRIPIYDDEIDSVKGFVLKSDILLAHYEDRGQAKLSELRREMKEVPESLNVLTLFDEMVKENRHICLVIDEYGGVAGVVTLEDIIETLTGLEIIDEKDMVQDMQKLARAQWEKRAKRMGLTPDCEDTPQ
jgi:CBS domain containing-hemolysin-like protein